MLAKEDMQMNRSPVTRLDDIWANGDQRWTLDVGRHGACRTVPEQSLVRFSLWLNRPAASQHIGRFALDVESALASGLVDRESETGHIRINLERCGDRIYLGRAGRGAPTITLTKF